MFPVRYGAWLEIAKNVFSAKLYSFFSAIGLNLSAFRDAYTIHKLHTGLFDTRRIYTMHLIKLFFKLYYRSEAEIK